MPTIANSLRNAMKTRRPSTAPLWGGPCGRGPQAGVTQSLLSRFLVCPERFRLLAMEGLKPADRFSHRMEYGNLWHAAEEALAQGKDWLIMMTEYGKKLAARYPMDRDDVEKWWSVCKIQFPIYVDYWKRHPDVEARAPVFAEKEFCVPHRLPSGRTAYLRGKWDSVDLIKKGANAGVWLQENKSKGEVNPEQLQRQLTYDLQTMLYLIALRDFLGSDTQYNKIAAQPIRGVRYNVVRRPLASGNKGSIQRRKGRPSKISAKTGKALKGTPEETWDEYYARLERVISGEERRKEIEEDGESDQPDADYFFMRWNLYVSADDIDKFQHETLDPVLENLADAYEWWAWCKKNVKDPFNNWYPEAAQQGFSHYHRHYRTPFGMYNPLLEGAPTDLDNYLLTGDKSGLQSCTDLFPELMEGK